MKNFLFLSFENFLIKKIFFLICQRESLQFWIEFHSLMSVANQRDCGIKAGVKNFFAKFLRKYSNETRNFKYWFKHNFHNFFLFKFTYSHMNISVNDIPFYLKKNLKLCLKEETVVSTVLIFTAKRIFKKIYSVFTFFNVNFMIIPLKINISEKDEIFSYLRSSSSCFAIKI